jgi:hypothetical protein
MGSPPPWSPPETLLPREPTGGAPGLPDRLAATLSEIALLDQTSRAAAEAVHPARDSSLNITIDERGPPY